jgi:ParB family transcriptional regulator, chromosome partitioning protein
MTAKPRGLGRGLDALIHDQSARKVAAVPPQDARQKEEAPPPSGGSLMVLIADIDPNPWQPRRTFAPEELEELAASIRASGVLQPLLVRREGDRYQLIAGERRLRASQLVGNTEVPVRVMALNDQEALEIALVENLQRADLNPVEEAEGYQRLMKEFGLTQEAVATRVGKSRPAVANALRLLSLAPRAKELLSNGQISSGHAKVLLSLPIPADQEKLALRVAAEQVSVRDLERIVQKGSLPSAPPPTRLPQDEHATQFRHLCEELQRHLGTAVEIVGTRKTPGGKLVPGRLEIAFYSSDDLDRLLQLLGMTDPL